MITDPAEAANNLVCHIESERERARKSAALARRHEALARQDTPLRELHQRHAQIHRRIERRHLVTLQLFERFLARINVAEHEGPLRRLSPPSLLSVTARMAGSSGAIMALVDSREWQTMFLASDATARRAHELEFAVGEGPSHDAVRARKPIAAANGELRERWHAYGPAVLDLDIASVAAIPLQQGSACLGALTLLNPTATSSTLLSDLGDALVGSLLEGFISPTGNLIPASSDQLAVQQAAGMISARHSCAVDDALAMIRARAFAENTSAADIADRILRHGHDL